MTRENDRILIRLRNTVIIRNHYRISYFRLGYYDKPTLRDVFKSIKKNLEIITCILDFIHFLSVFYTPFILFCYFLLSFSSQSFVFSKTRFSLIITSLFLIIILYYALCLHSTLSNYKFMLLEIKAGELTGFIPSR